jgi:hypothetical protein
VGIQQENFNIVVLRAFCVTDSWVRDNTQKERTQYSLAWVLTFECGGSCGVLGLEIIIKGFRETNAIN